MSTSTRPTQISIVITFKTSNIYHCSSMDNKMYFLNFGDFIYIRFIWKTFNLIHLNTFLWFNINCSLLEHEWQVAVWNYILINNYWYLTHTEIEIIMWLSTRTPQSVNCCQPFRVAEISSYKKFNWQIAVDIPPTFPTK